MAHRDNRGCKISLCLGLLVVYSSLSQCISLKRPQTSDKLGENATLSQAQGQRSHSYYGKLLIGLNSVQDASATKTPEDFPDVDSDYQSDMPLGHILGGWGALGQSNLDNTAVERLLKMDPTVECTGDSMRLQVQIADSKPGALFSVDRGSLLPPLPLSELPQSCGYTVPSTWGDLVLVAPYDGCFITLEMGCYILPLYWWGIPVRMSCPLRKPPSPDPPMVTCHPVGMVVKTTWTPPASKIRVNINGDWEPLTTALPRCGFSVVAHPEGVVISIRYTPCLENKGGMYSIRLFGDDGVTQISCPSWLPPPAEPTQTPPKFLYNPPNSGQPQMPQPYPPSLLYPWQANPPPKSQGEEPLYSYSVSIKQPPERNPTTSPPVQTTQSQTWLPHFPFPSYPQPPKQENPPTWPKPASDMVGQTRYQINAEFPGEWEQQSQLTRSTPPVSEEPLGPIYQSLYHFHPSFAGQSPYQTRVPPTQQTITPAPMYQEQKRQPPKHPGGSTFETHENQYYPLDYYSQSVFPFMPWPEKPTVAPEPPITPQPETPKGQIQQLHNLYYYLEESQNPQPVAIPPAPQTPQLIVHPGDQRPMDSVLSQSSFTGVSQYHQPHALYLPPVQCPQVCPAGISNCCPQIAFHQHLHHIVPAENDVKDKPPVNPGSPVSSSVAHSGFDYDLGYRQHAPKPDEEQETQAGAASPPASHQFLPVGMRHEMETYLQPPDGNIAALPGSNPSRGIDPGQQVYQHFEPNSQYSYRPLPSQAEELQGPVETFSSTFSKPHPPRYNPVKPENQYNSLLENAPLLPQNIKHAFGPNLMDINKHVQLQPSSYANGERPMSITEPDLYLFPHQMLQDAQEPTLRKLIFKEHSSQMPQIVNILKKPTKREETDWSHSEPKSYRLLRRGPPGSKFRKSPLPFRELFGESDSPGPQAASNSKNNPQHPKWLDEEKFSDFDSIPSPGVKSESLLFSASDGIHSVPLSREASVGPTKLQTEVGSFKDFWKGRRVPDKGFPLKSLQHWSSANDNQQNGLNQPVQRKGHMKQQ
ncbi:proline-rich extensin-like protein EPR1 [Sphaeramia orbicularis]|uniref:proline-rich extensin-like protein EPR1 n=1 Tax=Sphaeramia orbicularis TaxID=375764 RepID=UPI00117F8251|nr:proline-rich extensin-like protein EPR1 [Sphaeramia orbicularis]